MICIFWLPRCFQGGVKIIESLLFLHLGEPQRLHGLQMLFVLQVSDLLMQTSQFTTTYVREPLPHFLEVLLLVLLLRLSVGELLGGGQARRVKRVVRGGRRQWY